MLRVGIIGFGKMGILHGALMCGSREGQVVAICDKAATMRIGFKKVYGHGVHTYIDAEKMFAKETLDVVIVTTPTFNHEESVLMALEHGCHVFVEKPLAITAEQAKHIQTVAAGKNLAVQVGYCNRFAPTIRRGKELLDAGTLGKITRVSGQMFIGDVFEEHRGWRYKKELSGGGALMDFGIHLVDLFVWYFGPIHSVKAQMQRLYSKEVEDALQGEISFDCGVTGTLETSWSSKDYRKSYTHIEIEGTQGRMVITDQTLLATATDGNVIEEDTNPDLYGGCFMDIGGALYSDQMQSFLDYVHGEEAPGCTAEQGAYVQTVIESLYRSTQAQQTVEVEHE